MLCALYDEVAEIGGVKADEEAALEPRNLAAADENRNAEHALQHADQGSVRARVPL